MIKVTITGWRYGLQKISLDSLLARQDGWGIQKAFHAVNKLLAGQEVEVNLNGREEAEAFLREAESIGAICELSENE